MMKFSKTVTREAVLKLQEQAEKALSKSVATGNVLTLKGMPHLEYVRLEWSALQAELGLAALGGPHLVAHPGYRHADVLRFFFNPAVQLEDITDAFQTETQAHVSALETFASGFVRQLDEVDTDIAERQKEMEAVKALEENLVSLRNQRRQAFAGGESSSKLDKDITQATTQFETQRLRLPHIEDIIEGLRLRREALEKAHGATQTGMHTAKVILRAVQFCRVAAEYNHHAQKAAALFRQLYDAQDSVLTLASEVPAGGWQHGFPGIRYTRSKNHLGHVCSIPRIGLHWSKGGATDEPYFYQTSEALYEAVSAFVRRHNP